MKISLPTSLDEKSHFAIHTLDAMGNLLRLVLFSNFPITSLNTEATFQLELLLDKKISEDLCTRATITTENYLANIK